MNNRLSIIAGCLGIFIPHALLAAPPLKLGDADVVPQGRWEVWTTCDFEDYKSKHKLTSPRFEVIYGILPRVELGVETAYLNEREDGRTESGFGFLAMQPKVLLLEETPDMPALGTSLLLEVPFNDGGGPLEWGDREWAPSLAIQKHFGPTLWVGQVKGCFDSGGDALFWRYGIDAMHKVNDKLKLLAEIYAESHLESDMDDELNFRLGFKYNFAGWGKVYFAAGRSLLPAENNRPRFDLSTGLMFEF